MEVEVIDEESRCNHKVGIREVAEGLNEQIQSLKDLIKHSRVKTKG